jgi:O-glycosyl hydrolase
MHLQLAAGVSGRHSWRFLLALGFLLGAIVSACAGGSSSAIAGKGTVTVDLRRQLQLWDGFGSSERVFSDPHVSRKGKSRSVVPPEARDKILSLLYGRLGLTRVRVVLNPGIERERGGPFDFSGIHGEDQIPFIREAIAHGLKTFFPGPVNLEAWIGPTDVGPYVDWAMTVLRWWRSKGLEPPLFAPVNEPQIARNFPPRWMHDVVIQLGRRLKAEGFKTKLVVPDDENPADAYRRAEVVLADPEARAYVAALAYHIYRGRESDWAKFKQLADRYGLRVWMTEWHSRAFDSWPGAYDWAVKIHDLITIGGVSAIDYIWGFFGDWGDSYVELHFDDNAVYTGLTLSPIYYLTGQWSRYVRPGYRRIGVSPESGSVLTTAFRGPKRIVIVSLNVSSVPQTVAFEVRGGRLAKKAKVTSMRTSPTETWKALPKTLVRARSTFTARLPVRSVTTLIVPLASR